jgi:carbon storage regulator CsrA
MLVLTLKDGQGVQIGEAHVTVAYKSDGKIKISIEAPQHVRILRDDAKVKLDQGAPQSDTK